MPDFVQSLWQPFSFLTDAYDRGLLLDGAVVTLKIFILSACGSLLVGATLAAVLIGDNNSLKALVRTIVELLRNTPSLVQLYFAYFVLNSLFETQNVSPLVWAVIVLSLYKGVFTAEVLRAGLEAVPPLSLEAATMLGLSRRQIFWRVQLPIALRFALPAQVNILIDLVKNSAIASAIAVGEITYAAILIWSDRDNVMAMMVILLLFFNALTLTLGALGRWAERHLHMPGYQGGRP